MTWTVYSHTDYTPAASEAETSSEEEARALARAFVADRGKGDGRDFAVMRTVDFAAWTEHDYDSYP